ncbi:hypothetical protein CA803_13195 [Staphylococcus aureus]|nr:hypothetical protein CA803_13195 [Staphylococcus aureus]
MSFCFRAFYTFNCIFATFTQYEHIIAIKSIITRVNIIMNYNVRTGNKDFIHIFLVLDPSLLMLGLYFLVLFNLLQIYRNDYTLCVCFSHYISISNRIVYI